MNKNQNNSRILIFLAFAFGIPWAAALVIYLSGMAAANLTQAVGLANTFFIATPWLANIAARLITKEGWGNLHLRPNFKRGWQFYLAVWFLPLAAVIVGGGLFYLLFPQSFDPNLGALTKLLPSVPGMEAISPWLILLSSTVSILLLSIPLSGVASMGEEFGWRAYLLPKLVERFSGADGAFDAAAARKAALLTGVVHGVWHWPLMLMGASLVPGSSFLTPVVYLVFTCGMSVLLSWATLRSGSVWPAAIGHGAVNATSALPGFLLKGAPISLIGPDPTGLVGGIGYVILALVLLFSRKAFAGVHAENPQKVEPKPSLA